MTENFKCRLFGHSWLYKDLANAVKANGRKYSYSAIRKCKRCDKHQYKYAEWIEEKLVLSEDKEEVIFPRIGNKVTY